MATFTVSNTNATGAGSLRQAIDLANAAIGADAVVFQAGVTGAINLAGSGSLAIEDALTITGPGAGVLAIVADADTQVFDVNKTAVPIFNASISGLTLTGVNGLGGAAIAAADANLRLSGMTLTGNVGDPTSFGAGGVVLVGSGDLTIDSSTISGNSGFTGAIQLVGAGNLTLRSSTVSGNTGDTLGGGAGGIDFDGANLTIEASTISGNTGLIGGVQVGISSGDLTVRSSTISGNTGDLSGNSGGFALIAGGLSYVGFGNATIEASTIAGNSAGVDGAGGLALFGLGPGSMTVSRSTISGNTGGTGGALVGAQSADFVNVTVANNVANGDPFFPGAGGLVFLALPSAVLRNSTVAGNTDAGGSALAEDVASLGTPLQIQNSILYTAGGLEDLYFEGVGITSNYSLIGSYYYCGCVGVVLTGANNLIGTDPVLGFLANVDPLLGPLANNGGPVQTMLPLGGPAINAGDPAFVVPFVDARGYFRVVGRLDLGAVETGSSPFFVVLPEPSSPSPAPPPPSQGPLINAQFNNLVRFNNSIVNPLPLTVTTPTGQVLPNPLLAQQKAAAALVALVDSGRMTLRQALDILVDMADATTSAATMSYQFFTGKIPSKDGLDYLVSSPMNPNDLNDGFYAGTSLENRYINMAVNLGRAGEGAAAFAAGYGALSLTEATAKAYTEIFGTPPAGKIADILTPDRIAYFNSLGGDPLGAKAAMVGWLLAESAKSDVGPYAVMNENFLYDLADGVAAYGADMRIYLNAGPRYIGLIGMAEDAQAG